MKIIYVDTAVDGHHITYLSALLNDENNEYVRINGNEITFNDKNIAVSGNKLVRISASGDIYYSGKN